MFSFNPLLKIAFVSHNEIDNIEEDLLKDKADLKRLDVGDNEAPRAATRTRRARAARARRTPSTARSGA